jgi:ATPase family associated with various cellular activities (AAA)
MAKKSDLPDVGSFGAAFEDFMQAMTSAAERPESDLLKRVREHLGTDPRELPSTAASWPTTDHPNVQLALDDVLADAEVLGYNAPQLAMFGVSVSALLAGQGMTGPIALGPVQYTDVAVGDGRVVQCVSAGLYLARYEDAPVALVLSRSERPYGSHVIKLEGISPRRPAVEALFSALRDAMREHNVFRGQVISLHMGEDRSVSVQYHRVSEVSGAQVILPVGTLGRIERHSVGLADHAEALRQSGRHLKRGILLHGPPGTGKTLTVRYLIGAMPGRTTILLTGRGLGLIEQALAIARELVPATVVFEDIDLVAAERTMPMATGGPLFDLLNQMEGLDEDADLLFLLTTNRPDVVEPALAARPGRIDLAVEIPLPDDNAREQLLRLYAQGIELDSGRMAELIERTEGTSGAFVKELMRQAAVRAAMAGREAETDDVVEALDELLSDRALLTRRLLGQPAEGTPSDSAAAPPFPAMLQALTAAGLPIPPGIMGQ